MDENNSYLPLFIDMTGKTALVVGGGAVAQRKVSLLLRHGATVRVVSPQVSEDIRQWAAQGLITLSEREFSPEDARGVFLVFATTNSAETNNCVEASAKRYGALLNRTDATQTEVMIPSVVERGNLQIAISTTGSSPSLARSLRLQLEEEFDASWEEYTALLSQLRQAVLARINEPDLRRRILASIDKQDYRSRICAGETLSINALLDELVSQHRNSAQ